MLDRKCWSSDCKGERVVRRGKGREGKAGARWSGSLGVKRTVYRGVKTKTRIEISNGDETCSFRLGRETAKNGCELYIEKRLKYNNRHKTSLSGFFREMAKRRCESFFKR